MNFIMGTLIGIIGACLTSFAYVPQVSKMWRRKSCRDVSNVTIFQTAIGCSLWLIYGIYRIDYVLVTANVVIIVTLVMALFLYYRYRVKEE